MTKNDTPLIHHGDIGLALALLTRLPVRVTDASRGAAAAWAYPVVGVIIGGLSALAGLSSIWLGLPALFAALLTLGLQIALTGAMHEDGFADTVDGFWGAWDRTDRLRIMKDSHIGTYGVLALIFGFTARVGALWTLFQLDQTLAVTAIISAAAFSRAMMPSLMASLPHARDSGLSHSVGSVRRRTALLAFAIAALCALALLGVAALPAMIAAVASGWAVAMIARSKIGGQTGDVLGATQQVCEIIVLVSFIA